jgi:hypothetical protein
MREKSGSKFSSLITPDATINERKVKPTCDDSANLKSHELINPPSTTLEAMVIF